MKDRFNKGLSSSLMLIAGLAVLITGLFIVFFLRRTRVNLPTTDKTVTQMTSEDSGIEEPAEISDSDEIEVIEQELEDTQEGSFDSDFQELDEEASSL